MALGNLQFAAFLSYSRKDQRLASWLVRSLEELRLPQKTVADLKARKSLFTAARPIFRDELDMPVGGAIPTRLAEVIDASASMIVLCTSESSRSEWVNREVKLFAERHPSRPIIPAVAEGAPETDDCYPPALLALGKPLAADLRIPGERRQAVVKIAAAILGLDVDQLSGRVRKQRAERMRWMAAGGGIAAGAFIGLGLMAWLTNNRAVKATDLAQTAVEVSLTDVREQVSATGTLSTRAAVLAVAEAYFDGKRPSDLTDKDLQLKAKMLIQKGQDAADRGETDKALEYREVAFAATEELLVRRKDDPDRLFDHGQSAFWVGEMHWRRGELDKARHYLTLYRDKSTELLRAKPNYPGAAAELAWANSNLGILAVEQFRDPRSGEALFAKAVAAATPVAIDTESKRNLNLVFGYQTLATAQFANATDVLALAAGWAAVLGELDEMRTKHRELNFQVARDLYVLGQLERRGGRAADGEALTARAKAIAAEELRSDSDNQTWLTLASKFDVKSTSGPVACTEFDFANLVDGHRAVSCMRHASVDRRSVCEKFVHWLPAQKPSFEAEQVWAALLRRCSRDPAVMADGLLMEALDSAAAARFFSGDPHGFSLWTQLELAEFKSTGRSAAGVHELKEDLKRRGWNGDQS